LETCKLQILYLPRRGSFRFWISARNHQKFREGTTKPLKQRVFYSFYTSFKWNYDQKVHADQPKDLTRFTYHVERSLREYAITQTLHLSQSGLTRRKAPWKSMIDLRHPRSYNNTQKVKMTVIRIFHSHFLRENPEPLSLKVCKTSTHSQGGTTIISFILRNLTQLSCLRSFGHFG
jgi:hypothetical protein